MSSGRFSLAGWALDTSLLFYKRTATSVSPGPIGPLCRPLPRGHFRPPRWASVWSKFGSRCNRGRPEAPPILRHLTPRSGGKPDLFQTPTTGFSGRRPSCSVDLHCQAKEKDYGSGLTEKLHCFSIWQANGTGCLFQRLGSSYKPAFCFRQMATEIWWNSVFGFFKGGRHVLWPTLKGFMSFLFGKLTRKQCLFPGMQHCSCNFCIAKWFTIWFGCYPVSLHISMYFKGECGLWPWDKLALMSCCCCCCNNSVQIQKLKRVKLAAINKPKSSICWNKTYLLHLFLPLVYSFQSHALRS